MRGRLHLAAALALVTIAAGLWLSSGAPSRAATGTATQVVSATVTNSISWGNQGTCLQSAGAAAFGSIAAGSSSSAPGLGVFTGCIGSNAPWSVTAAMTTPPSSEGEAIPASAFRLETATLPLGAGAAACPAGNSSSACTLDNAAVSVVDEAPATPLIGTILTNGFTYGYRLEVPSNQPAGTYTGGVITFTASN